MIPAIFVRQLSQPMSEQIASSMPQVSEQVSQVVHEADRPVQSSTLSPLPVAEELAADVPVKKSHKQSEYAVVLVHSGAPLSEIIKLINSYDPDAKPDASGNINGDAVITNRIDYCRTEKGYSESNRTILTVKRSAYNALVAAGFDKPTEFDFRVAEYEIRSSNHPPDGCLHALFIPVPPEMNPNTSPAMRAELERQMAFKMKSIVTAGILGPRDYRIHLPAYSRELDTARYTGYIIVTFSSRVDRDDCARVKLILDMTVWYDLPTEKDKGGEKYFCHVAWCRANKLAELNARYRTNRDTHCRPGPHSGAVHTAGPARAVQQRAGATRQPTQRQPTGPQRQRKAPAVAPPAIPTQAAPAVAPSPATAGPVAPEAKKSSWAAGPPKLTSE